MHIGDVDVCMLSMTLMDVVERLLIDGGIIESDCCCSLGGNNSFAVQHINTSYLHDELTFYASTTSQVGDGATESESKCHRTTSPAPEPLDPYQFTKSIYKYL